MSFLLLCSCDIWYAACTKAQRFWIKAILFFGDILMSKVLSTVCAAALMAVIGCGEKSTPGGPGATGSHTKTMTGAPANDTFRITVPMTSTTIKQGDQKEIEISVDRSKDFHEDV